MVQLDLVALCNGKDEKDEVLHRETGVRHDRAIDLERVAQQFTERDSG